MLKKFFIYLLLVLCMFLFSGCWNYIEINEQANVSGIAIDKGQNGKKYHITAELISISSGEKGAGVSTSIVEADGNTILETIRRMISISSKKLYFGHCRVMVLSKDIAEEGIAPILDFAMRDAELRLTIDLVISKADTAKEILMQKPILEKIVSYEIDEMLQTNYKILYESQKAQAYQFNNVLGADGISPVVPAFEVVKTNKEETTFKLSGIAIFNEDKLIGFLDEDETKTFLFVRNKVKDGVLSIQINDAEDDFIAIEIFGNKTKVKPVKQDGELSIEIETQTDMSIEQISANNKMTQQEFEDVFTAQLEQKMIGVIHKVQKDFKVDIFGFGNMINQKNPKLWEEYQSNWDETFKTLKVKVKSKVEVKSSGTTYELIQIGEK
ncbi:Ger(x)C family spore germination protein [Hydrogenoanaerobacterium sp.]|uniref:Ger(x)C family spore germination protein n=1 Tax=Hydrogenoanaerobacterium sp. TaxID=2953763 RepID=UPI002899E84A|nr:Ger(x)C family spore germination protein [Hydrogenoanaerobacterium sp.]